MSPVRTRRTLRICHLYPELMNLYGDRGNIIALVKRMEWHGLDPVVERVSVGQDDLERYDLIFMGGGQDREQKQICVDFSRVKGGPLRDAVESGVPLLAICGGYQLVGKYYRAGTGEVMDGAGVLDAWTEAGNTRFIGNVVVESDLAGSRQTLVGFENHSGKTYLGPGVRPLGRVICGFGNNGADGFEGAVYKNAVGTYLHGSVLPKNPWLADWLISRALERRFGERLEGALDDSIEQAAHAAAIKRASMRTV